MIIFLLTPGVYVKVSLLSMILKSSIGYQKSMSHIRLNRKQYLKRFVNITNRFFFIYRLFG